MGMEGSSLVYYYNIRTLEDVAVGRGQVVVFFFFFFRAAVRVPLRKRYRSGQAS